MTRWWRDDAESAERSPQDADASERDEGSTGSVDTESFSSVAQGDTALPPAPPPLAPIQRVTMMAPVERVAMLLEQLFIAQPGPVADLLQELRRCSVADLVVMFGPPPTPADMPYAVSGEPVETFSGSPATPPWPPARKVS